MKELSHFLGLQIKQAKVGIFINQSKYISDTPKKYGMESTNATTTPMNTTTKLTKDEESKEVDEKLYRGMIRSLFYLTTSRLGTILGVCLCARFQCCPKYSHLSDVKRIFRYLSGSKNVGLWNPKNDCFDLVGYSDADHAGSQLDRKNTSVTCQFLGNSLVSWFSKKQNCVALSTTESEYVAVSS